jgi:hypothetical protein
MFNLNSRNERIEYGVHFIRQFYSVRQIKYVNFVSLL